PYSMLKHCLPVPLLLLLLLHHTYAQEQPYRFSSLNNNNGLSNNQVNCIYKDARGFMWFGTMTGLNRYDGYTFKVFRHSQGDSLSLNDDYISGIFPAPGNRLYIKTRNGDNLYDPEKEQFSDAGAWLREAGLPGYGVNSVHRAGGSWWVAYADSGLYRLDSARKAVQVVRPRSRTPLADICPLADHRLAILYLNGDIEMLDMRSGKVISRTAAVARFIDKQPLALRLFV